MRRSLAHPLAAAQNGVFLPKMRRGTRKLAENSPYACAAMDSAVQKCSMVDVVTALPLRALFASQLLYPSPIGRPDFTPSRPSTFRFKSNLCAARRQVAHGQNDAADCFDTAPGQAIDSRTRLGDTKQGETTCIQNSKPYLCLSALAGWRPVGIRRWNRPLSVLALALAPLRCWMEICSPGPLSGLRAISSIARPKKVKTADANRAWVDVGAISPQWGRATAYSHWLLSVTGVYSTQWGASNQRGAQYGLYQSSTSTGCLRGVCRARAVEPHGVRPLSYDTDHKLIGHIGAFCADLADPINLTKRMSRETGACALSCSAYT